MCGHVSAWIPYTVGTYALLVLYGSFLQMETCLGGCGKSHELKIFGRTENWKIFFESLPSCMKRTQLLGVETGKPSFTEKRCSDDQTTCKLDSVRGLLVAFVTISLVEVEFGDGATSSHLCSL